MTVERSQEAVEAAAKVRCLQTRRWSPDCDPIIREELWAALSDVERDAFREAVAPLLAAADAVDPCVPVRVLREWIAKEKAWVRAGGAFEVASLIALAALLDEHANERTDT